MLVYEKAKPLTGIDLNYEVVGGLTPPTIFNKENTIWVNTTVNKEKEAKVKFTEIAYYIGSDDGKVKSSSNTVKTAYFPCVAGHEYHFQLTDGQTVVISSFTQTPASGVVGTNIFGSGSTTGLETLDYTVIATESMAYLAIYYYNSSTNTSIPTLTIADITLKNTLPNEYQIAEYAFSYTNPWVDYEDIDYIPNSTIIQDKYLGSSGGVTAGDGTNAPCYTENYIPVEYGKTYNINYELSASKSMWFAVCEYTGVKGSYTFKTRNVVVNSVTGTSQSFTYTPSATTVTAVRLSWRTFYPSGTTYTVSFVKPDVEFNTAVIGDTWIGTDIDKAPVSFNAIKRNELMVYPYKLRQWDGSKWKAMAGSLYQNDTAISVYKAGESLYTYGIQDVAWEGSGHSGDSGSTTFGDSSVTITAKGKYGTNGRYQTMRTVDPIDLTNYSTIKAVVSGYALNNEANLSDGTNGFFHMGIADSKVDNIKGDGVASININPTEKTTETREVSMDISGYTGEYYINITVHAYRINNPSNTGYVHSVILE